MPLLKETESLFLRWEHPQKQRYYQIYLSKDMLQDYVLTKSWGGIGENSGRMVHVAYSSCTEAIAEVKKVTQVRKTRGYLLISDKSSDIGM